MPTLNEILALEAATRGTSGMSVEEQRRRAAAIAALSQTNPDLAYDMAKGPYRINEGVGSTVTPQEGWQRGPQPQQPPSQQPIMGTIDRWRSSQPQPSNSGPVVPVPSMSNPNAYNTGVPRGAPPSTGARYDFPANSSGQPVVININTTQPTAQSQGFEKQPNANYTFPQFDMRVRQPEGNVTPTWTELQYQEQQRQQQQPSSNIPGPRYSFPPNATGQPYAPPPPTTNLNNTITGPFNTTAPIQPVPPQPTIGPSSNLGPTDLQYWINMFAGR